MNFDTYSVKGGKMKKKKTKKRLIIFGIIVAIIIILIVSLVRCGQKAAEALFEEDVATVRDIQNYHSFTGTISAKDDQLILPEMAAKVTEIKVEKGDYVKKGDVIMLLDTENTMNSIEDLETTISLNAVSSSLSLQDANNTYNNYVSNIANSNNSNLNSAEQQVEAALESWVLAKKAYENEVSLNSKGYSQTLISSTSRIDTAYNNLLSAQASYDSVHNSEFSDKYQKEQATATRENAEISYQMSIKEYEAAKINEDINLTKLYDNLIQAQNKYYNAVDNYNTTKVQVYQQIDTYKIGVAKAQIGTDQTLNELKLKRLYEELDKCVVKAPRDGIITSIDVKEGDFTTIGKSVAEVTDYDVLQVEIKINEYDIGKTSVGSPVDVYVNALEKTYEGTITYIDRNATVDNGVSYFKAEVSFEAEEDVRCGMSVEVRTYTANKPNVLTIPSEAVMSRADGTAYVMLKNDDGSTTEQNIETGLSDGTYIEIVSGLEEGQKITYIPATFDALTQYMQESQEADGF